MEPPLRVTTPRPTAHSASTTETRKGLREAGDHTALRGALTDQGSHLQQGAQQLSAGKPRCPRLPGCPTLYHPDPQVCDPQPQLVGVLPTYSLCQA